MTIPEIKEMRAAVEKQIREICLDFESRTGLYVSDIEVDSFHDDEEVHIRLVAELR